MRALAAMSGGVDSTVAARLAIEAGLECIGCTMKLFDGSESEAAAEDAARSLGIPFVVFDARETFKRCVIDHFAQSYMAGMTPNPCVECNRHLKFGALLRHAEALGCGCLVTGHYAQVVHCGDELALTRAADAQRDQSYVLYRLTQRELYRVIFPLGAMTKAEVRARARALGLAAADRPDSQDICFVPDGRYAEVVEHVCGRKSEPGSFVDSSGRAIGRHSGIVRCTIGQHRGLGLNVGRTMYVISIDAQKNEVVVGERGDLMRAETIIDDVSWTCSAPPRSPLRCTVMIRYRAPEQAALVTPLDGRRARIEFDSPQRAIAPGQSAVFYDGSRVLGGGIIARASA